MNGDNCREVLHRNII